MLATPASAVSLVAAGSATTGGAATSISFTMPTGTTQYDVMVIQLAARGGTGTTITPPSGWTLLDRQDSTTVLAQAIYYRVAGSGEAGPYTFTITNNKASGGIATYRGVDNSNPIDAFAGQPNAAGLTITAPSITTTVANTVLIGMFSTAIGTTLAQPLTMTSRWTATNTGGGANTRTTSLGADEAMATAGATGTRAATALGSAVNIGHLIALRPPTVGFSASTSAGSESVTSVTIPVTLSGASSASTTVNYAVSGGTATASGTDYTLASGTLTFNAGVTSQNIAITVANDALDEADETIIVTLSSPSNANLGTSSHTYTIQDDDPSPTVTLGLSGTPMAEAAGVSTVTATLSGASSLDVTVNLAFSGTATLTSDYSRSGASITILAGATSGSVTLTASQDALDEDAETIVVDIDSVTNGAESGTQQVTATITDDDAPPTVTLGVSGTPMAEAGGAATVTATLSGASGLDVTVDLAFAGTATLTDDYTRTGTSITITAGSTTGSITLTAQQDTLDEFAETIIVDVSSVTNGAESGTQQVTATITDDDAPPSVTLGLGGSPMAEAAGVSTVTATLDAASGKTVTVNLTFAGTASLGTDYSRSEATIVVPAGNTSASITLTAIQDAIAELNETIVVDIDSVTNGAESGTQQVTATITDDETGPTVELSISGTPMAESAAFATVTATLSATSAQDVTVNLTFSGNASLGADYTRSGASITITAGGTTGSITLTAVQDLLDEYDESIIVDIDSVTNAAENGTQQVTALITDDDAPPSVTLSVSGSPLAENAAEAIVNATLSAASGKVVIVSLGFSGTATLGADYTSSGTSITISPGATVGSITLTAVQDALDEDAETIAVDITGVANGTESGVQQVTALITDDDAPPSVSLGLSGSPMAEAAGSATLTATLSGASGKDVTVNLSFAGSAAFTSDYTKSASAITISAGATTGSITLTAVQDALDEDDETIVVDVDSVANGTESGTQQQSASITDDDAMPTVSLSVLGSPMAEAAGAASVTATLSGASGKTVIVGLAFNGSATLTSDYTRSGTSISISPGGTTGSITLTAVQDALDEDSEIIIVDIGSVTNGTEDGTQQVTASITDDDAAPTVSLSLLGSPMDEAAGASNVTVTLGGASGKDVTVGLLFSGSATLTSDYTRSTSSILIPAGSTSGVVTLTAVDDVLDEDMESIVVDIGSLTNGTEDGVQQVTATISDDDAVPTVSLGLTGSPMAEAAGVGTVTATLSGASGKDVTVTLAMSGSATLGTDYTRSDASIAILAGATTGSITLTAVQDALDEINETIVVDIDTVANATENGVQQVTALINDDDSVPTVSLGLSGSPMAESGGSATVTASLNSASGLDVTVNLTFSGNATLAADYTRSATSLLITAGSTSASMTLSAVSDALDEPAETIIADIDSVANATENGTQQVTATISDDDAAPTVDLSLAGSAMAEAGGSATITATLSAASGQDVTINLGFGGSATLASDYTRSATSILITAGSTSGSISVTGVADLLDEDPETVILDISGVANATENGTQQVTVTITDDDSPPTVSLGLLASPLAENAGAATFTATLSAASGKDVTVTFAFGGNATLTSDYTRSATSLTILAGALSGSITVTGVDDGLDEPDESIIIDLDTASNATESGTQQVIAVIADDDAAPSVTLALSSANVAEAAGASNLTATLSGASGRDITVAFAFSGTAAFGADYGRSGASITILAGATTGTVQLTAIQDALDEPDETIVVDIDSVSNATESGTQQVTANILDDDAAPSVTLSVTGSPVAEAAGVASVTASLGAASGRDVLVDLSFSGTATLASDYTRSGTSILVPAGSTSAAITVTAIQDLIDEVDETVIVDISSVANGTESGTQQATVTISDDDAAPSVTLFLAGSPMAEAAGVATVSANLSAVSSRDVLVNFSFSGTATPGSDYSRSGTSILVPAGSTSADITLTAIQDLLDEVAETIIIDIASVANGTESGVQQVTASIADDDAPPSVTLGLLGSPMAEAAGGATITATLSGVSGLDVSVSLGFTGTASLTADYTRSGSTILVGAGATSASISIAAVQDSLDEANETIIVDITAVANGTESGSQQVTAAITDDDAPTVTLSVSDSLATEVGPNNGAFLVTRTTGDTGPALTVHYTVSGTATNGTDYTAMPGSITIASGQATATITVGVLDDVLQEGIESVALSLAPNAAYVISGTGNASLNIVDDDTAGITVSPTSGLSTSESGGTDNFTIVLNTQPAADVTVAVSSGDPGEAVANLSSVTFSSVDWATVRYVTVTGADDFLIDGSVAFTIILGAATSTDSNYAGIDADDVSGANGDDDLPTFTVTPASGLITTESGGTDTFTIVLDSRPSANVTIGLSSSDTSEGTVSPASLTFGAANWSIPQTVTLTGVNDPAADGNVAYTILTAAAVSADPNYDGQNPADVSATNNDNDVPGITVSPTSGLVTSEAGGDDAFTIMLTTQPTANVTIALSSSDPSEATVSPGSVTFTVSSWSTAQTITVTGADDFVIDGNASYTVLTAAASSSDGDYAGLDADDVGATNLDDDIASIIVSPTSGLATSESGANASFTIVLATQPSANVSIALSSSNTGEGTVAPAVVVFGPGNWSVAQTVTLTGVDDLSIDGSVAYTIITAAAVSADADYTGLDASDVAASNNDNDTPGVTVSPTSGLVTNEAGGTANFTIVLNTVPSSTVTITLSSSDPSEGTLSAASVTFGPGNWSIAQTVTVTGIDDVSVDGNVSYEVVTSSATSADANYDGITVSNILLTNNDDDVAGITVSPTSGLAVAESGTSDTFTIVLQSQPSATVTIGLSSGDATEAAVSPSLVAFGPGNWSLAQTVTVTGIDDATADGAIAFTIITSAASSADPDYSAIDPSDVAGANGDDDVPGFTIAESGGTTAVTEAQTTDSFTVVLNLQPLSNVTVTVSSADPAEAAVQPASLVFTASNWATPQAVTMRGVDDGLVDGSQSTVITIAIDDAASSNEYDLVADQTLNATTSDNDAPSTLVATPAAPIVAPNATLNITIKGQNATGSLVVLPSGACAWNATASGGSLVSGGANDCLRGYEAGPSVGTTFVLRVESMDLTLNISIAIATPATNTPGGSLPPGMLANMTGTLPPMTSGNPQPVMFDPVSSTSDVNISMIVIDVGTDTTDPVELQVSVLSSLASGLSPPAGAPMGLILEVTATSGGVPVDIASATFRFTVQTSWITANVPAGASDVRLYHWTGAAWETLVPTIISQTDTEVSFEAVSTSLSPFVVGGAPAAAGGGGGGPAPTASPRPHATSPAEPEPDRSVPTGSLPGPGIIQPIEVPLETGQNRLGVWALMTVGLVAIGSGLVVAQRRYDVLGATARFVRGRRQEPQVITLPMEARGAWSPVTIGLPASETIYSREAKQRLTREALTVNRLLAQIREVRRQGHSLDPAVREAALAELRVLNQEFARLRREGPQKPPKEEEVPAKPAQQPIQFEETLVAVVPVSEPSAKRAQPAPQGTVAREPLRRQKLLDEMRRARHQLHSCDETRRKAAEQDVERLKQQIDELRTAPWASAAAPATPEPASSPAAATPGLREARDEALTFNKILGELRRARRDMQDPRLRQKANEEARRLTKLLLAYRHEAANLGATAPALEPAAARPERERRTPAAPDAAALLGEATSRARELAKLMRRLHDTTPGSEPRLAGELLQRARQLNSIFRRLHPVPAEVREIVEAMKRSAEPKVRHEAAAGPTVRVEEPHDFDRLSLEEPAPKPPVPPRPLHDARMDDGIPEITKAIETEIERELAQATVRRPGAHGFLPAGPSETGAGQVGKEAEPSFRDEDPTKGATWHGPKAERKTLQDDETETAQAFRWLEGSHD